MSTHAAWFTAIDYSAYDKKVHAPDRFEGQDDRQFWEELGTEPFDLAEPTQPTRLTNLPRQVRIKTFSGRLNLRQYPRIDSYRLGGIEPGTVAEVLDGIEGWYRIRVKIGTQTLTGWAQSDYMTPYEAPTFRSQGGSKR